MRERKREQENETILVQIRRSRTYVVLGVSLYVVMHIGASTKLFEILLYLYGYTDGNWRTNIGMTRDGRGRREKSRHPMLREFRTEVEYVNVHPTSFVLSTRTHTHTYTHRTHANNNSIARRFSFTYSNSSGKTLALDRAKYFE